jgi:secondary thiamine-phosphate synthase enzyme
MPIPVSSSERVEVIDVTAQVDQEIPDGAESGICTVFVRHTTAGVVVNENEQRLLSDIEGFLEEVAPYDGGYRHDSIDDNADAHLRAILLGESVTVPISGGKLDLGTWQSVLFVEADGPRPRQIAVVTIPA